ncbi:MAG: outer membrane beta-barrel protein [Thermoanaerobaculia bacterium]
MRLPKTLALCAFTLAGTSAFAQFTQYTEPGGLAREQQSRAEAAQEKAESARWTLGKWKIAPDIAISDVAWTDNVYDTRDDAETVSDVTATARAGFEGFIHLGPDVLFSLRAVPSYTYWADQDDLRSSHFTAGAGLFGLHNRLTWELAADHTESQSYANDELRVPLDLENESATLGLQVQITGPIGVFARGTALRARYPDRTPEGAVEADQSLDRDETVLSGGLFYRPRESFRLGLGVESAESDFEQDPGGRSNRSIGPLLDVDLVGNRVELGVNAVYRQVEFDSPDLEDQDQVSGGARLLLHLASRTDATLYGGRQLVYSALDESAYFTSQVVGGQLSWRRNPEHKSFAVAFLAETGTNDYEGTGGLGNRSDDIVNYGVNFTFPYRNVLELQIGVIESEIDSNLPEFDRSYTAIRTGIRLEPLRLGG